MRGRAKTAKAVSTWVAATGLGISVSWLGVRPVLDAAVPERLVAFPVAGSSAPLSTPALRPPVSPGPSTRGAAPNPTTSASRSASPLPRATPPSAAASLPAPAPAGWTATGDDQYVRTFRLTGGDATVRAGHGDVELVSATPRPGYVMSVTPAGSDPLAVSFTMINRASKLEVSWQDRAPVARVSEIP